MSIRVLNIWLVAAFLAGCTTSGPVTEEEMWHYLHDPANGLTRAYEQDGLRICLTYQPVDLMIWRHNGRQYAMATDRYRQLAADYGRYLYFVMSLSGRERNPLYRLPGRYEQFSDMVQTLAFGMREYVSLVTSEQDTLLLTDFLFPRMYGHSPSADILLVFDREKTARADWIQIQVREFGLGLGRRNFRFRAEAMRAIPPLKFNLMSNIKPI